MPKIWPMPVEVPAPIRFDLDQTHASYDRDAVERFHRADELRHAVQAVFDGFQGKISPVHFFWGSFDLCVTRFSGRVRGPPRPDRMQAEAYSHEVISCGVLAGEWRLRSGGVLLLRREGAGGLARTGDTSGSVERGAWESSSCATTRYAWRLRRRMW
jgi:hypothetical protein